MKWEGGSVRLSCSRWDGNGVGFGVGVTFRSNAYWTSLNRAPRRRAVISSAAPRPQIDKSSRAISSDAGDGGRLLLSSISTSFDAAHSGFLVTGCAYGQRQCRPCLSATYCIINGASTETRAWLATRLTGEVPLGDGEPCTLW
jgi:hypothetical protein